MLASSNWLRSFVNLKDIENDRLGEILTSLGLEVEGSHEFSTVQGGLQGVVIGKVLTCEPHPDADRLKVTTVDIGNDQPVQIVCGAPNVEAGQTVPVATIGTEIYTEDGSFKIKKAEIRGVSSEGMICAEDELGLGESHDGIMVLPDGLDVGTQAADYFEVETDYLYDIGLTPNRSDATHHIGIARDLAAYLSYHNDDSISVALPASRWPINSKNLDFNIDIIDNEAAPRYAGVLITDLTIKPSPQWMQNRLKALGMKPKNNVIDTTNYVMHEMGQPLHAFDVRQIAGDTIRVQKLAKGVSFTTLDEVNRTLTGDELMICDGDNNPLCMAGVFGGLNSGVKNDTRTIFLESAHFDAKVIRNASLHHQLRTDAAKIYEKGSDPSIVMDALKRAAYILQEIAGGTLASTPQDIYPYKVDKQHVTLRYDKVRELIGVDLSDSKIKSILTSLNMHIESESKGSVMIAVPFDKTDVLREVDIIEEILRIYGFDNVPTLNSVNSFMTPIQMPEKSRIVNGLKSGLIGQGFSEMMNLSLTNSEYYDDKDDLVFILNTSNRGLNVMRPSLMTSALEAAKYNLNRNQNSLKLFEIGKSYHKDGEKYSETEFLSILLTGNSRESHWTHHRVEEVTFYTLKSYVHYVFKMIGITGYQEAEMKDEDNYLYGLRYHRGSKTIARLGRISGDFAKNHGVKNELFYAEIDMKTLIRTGRKAKVFYEKINKFPRVHREISILVEDKTQFASIEKIIRKSAGSDLVEINVLTVYEDEEKLGNKKSVSIELIFENKEKTLTDNQVNKQVDKILNALRDKLSIELR